MNTSLDFFCNCQMTFDEIFITFGPVREESFIRLHLEYQATESLNSFNSDKHSSLKQNFIKWHHTRIFMKNGKLCLKIVFRVTEPELSEA